MQAWRIFDDRAVHARAADFNPLSGHGGLHQRGRWHHKGLPIIYTSSSPGVALLEVLVHETSESFRERTLLQLEMDGTHEQVTPQQLVRFLADAPAGSPEKLTRDFGTEWLAEQRSLALIVPSIVLPIETNIIINPVHPEAKNLRIVSSDVITLDRRLVRSLGGSSLSP